MRVSLRIVVYMQKRAPSCALVSKMAKKIQGGLSSPNISGKITAYKYVLSESLCRAAERSSFGNSLRSFATVVLRVHCAQSFRPTCLTCTYSIRISLLCEREKKGRYKKKRSCLHRSIRRPLQSDFSDVIYRTRFEKKICINKTILLMNVSA